MSEPLGTSYQNRPDPGASFTTPAQAVPRATMDWRTDKTTFIGVGISGGGSRAANFGMAALEQMQALGLLEHVDAVSAVSGGSIPAAFYALNGERADWAARGRAVVARDFLSDFLGRLFSPANILASTLTDKDRSDLLAEVFERDVLDGPKRFADLGARGPRRPAVFFNATDTTNGGRQFVFADDRFFRLLGSDLSAYPIAWAMAASGAFPAIFNSVTLRKYSIDPQARRQEQPLPDRRYIHLIDGGPSDNLGTDTLIDLARQHHVQLVNRRIEPRGCLIVVVDSHVPNASIAEAKRSDRRNWLAPLFDVNFFDAIDALLTNRRRATLATLGIRPDQALGQFNIELGHGLIEYGVQPYRRVSSFDIEYFEQDGRAIARPSYAGLPETLDFQGQRGAVRKTFPCLAWHVALDDVDAVVPWKDAAGAWQPLRLEDPSDRELLARRGRLARFVKQVATNYRLAGPPQCAVPQVQQALYDVARITMREDKASVEAVCRWLGERGLGGGAGCAPLPAGPAGEGLDLEPIDAPANATADEQETNRFVRCPGAPEPMPAR